MIITVGIVEDDRGVCGHLQTLIEKAPGFSCVNVWHSGEDALPELLKQPPDIVLMDVHLPGMSGIDCVAALKGKLPDVHVLMLTVYEDSEKIFRALSAGANGYLVKYDIPKKLIPALKEILSGGAPMSSHIARRVVSYFQEKTSASSVQSTLSPREKDVLGLLAEGYLDKEIAEKLNVGRETVRTHVQHIYQKLQVRTRTEAVIKFLSERSP